MVLDVSLWQSNTRLYKAVNKKGLQIECRAPLKKGGRSKALDERRLTDWVESWAQSRHGAKLVPTAAAILLELVGPEFGLLDQELAKLALFTKAGGEITPEMVRDVVGGWKTKDVWELMDAACDGNAGEALSRLDRLLHVGESPQALFGQISWTMRRFAAATRIFERSERSGKRMRLSKALQQAGFRAWPESALTDAERRLLQLGRQRTSQFYRWLLEADLALKLSHSSPQRGRLVLETLLLRMASQLAPKRTRH
jgi:DNA polymerase-3 subunit delta